MKSSMAARLGIAFLVASLVYAGVFVGCLGTEPGTTASATCETIGLLLKTPLLHVLPYASTRYFGIDSFLLFSVLNMLFWGGTAAAVAWVLSRRSRIRRPGGSS